MCKCKLINLLTCWCLCFHHPNDPWPTNQQNPSANHTQHVGPGDKIKVPRRFKKKRWPKFWWSQVATCENFRENNNLHKKVWPMFLYCVFVSFFLAWKIKKTCISQKSLPTWYCTLRTNVNPWAPRYFLNNFPYKGVKGSPPRSSTAGSWKNGGKPRGRGWLGRWSRLPS